MHLPDYKCGLVNLMSSIEKVLGGKPLYKPLEKLPPKDLDSTNIVLIVIDGFGYEQVKQCKSVLKENLKGSITSVFPPTTASCMTTLFTGVAPQQHAITGWFMYLKEIGSVILPLPYIHRGGKLPLGWGGIDPEEIFESKPFFDKIKADSFIVLPHDLTLTDFTITMSGKADTIPYSSLEEGFDHAEKIIKHDKKKKLIFVYEPEFDIICHKSGTKSKKAINHIREVEKIIGSFLNSIEGTNTTVIVTADHGFSDVTKSNTMKLEDHPKLKETLILPLCGEARMVYCYVKPGMTKQFEEYVRKHMKCQMFKGAELVEKNFYGLFEPNEKLSERVGDYVLVMDDGYALKDILLGEEDEYLKAYHGGLSREEMLIPLIVKKI